MTCHISMERIKRCTACGELFDDVLCARSCCPHRTLPPGWDAIAAAHDRKMFWLKWTVIFPFMLVLVISLFLLFTHTKAHAAEQPFYCKAFNSLPRTCDSVHKITYRYGTRAAIWMARKCGATDQDIEEAKKCEKPSN